MGLLGKGVLVNWGGIVKSKEQDYNSGIVLNICQED